MTADLQAQLLAINGVTEVLVVPDEQAAYIKVDRKLLDNSALNSFSAAQV